MDRYEHWYHLYQKFFANAQSGKFRRYVRLTFINYRKDTTLSLEQCVDLAIRQSFPSIDSEDTYRQMECWKCVMKKNFIDVTNRFREFLTPPVDVNNGDNNNALTVRAGDDDAQQTIDQTIGELQQQREALNRICNDPATGAEDP